MNETGKIIQAASRFGGSTSQDERDRLVADAIDQAAKLVETMHRDGMPLEVISGHIRGMSPYAGRDSRHEQGADLPAEADTCRKFAVRALPQKSCRRRPAVGASHVAA